MKDFQQHDDDFAGFLTGATQALWGERGLDEPLAEIMHPQVILRDAQGVGLGPGGVGTLVLSTLAACPDLKMRSEDVLSCGNAQIGMLGAQRAIATGHHRGAGLFGAPTGRKVSFRIMTDSYAKAQRISDIWQVRDTGAVLRQTGRDIGEWARQQVLRADAESAPFRPEADMQGPYTGRGNTDSWAAAFAHLLERVMQGAFSAIHDQYDPACELAYTGGRRSHGPDAAEAFWLGLRASLPSARFTIHHQIGLEEPLMPPRCALRWSLTGRHDGWGALGTPTGAMVHLMGISHAEFGPAGLRREWSLYDEAAIAMQLAHKAG